MQKDTIKRVMELLFISFVGSVLLLGSGCGGNERSCEKPRFESKDGIIGVLVPGCGGCLDPGEGCRVDTCGLWSEGIIGIGGSLRSGNDEIGLIALENGYYEKGGCAGCEASKLRSCYAIAGYLSEDADGKPESGNTSWVIAIGKTPDIEIGVVKAKGCVGCSDCGSPLGHMILREAERYIFK